MKVWLTRQRNGQYMLTKYKPIIAQVEGRSYTDAYIVPGEPIGVRNLCDAMLQLLDNSVELKRGDSIEIELHGTILKSTI